MVGPETACQSGNVFLTTGLAGQLVTRLSGPSRSAAPRGGLCSARAEPPSTSPKAQDSPWIKKNLRAGVEDEGEKLK